MVLLRWGFCAAGKMSFDFANALFSLPRDKHGLEAVAARDVDRAKQFAGKFGFSKAYGDYEALANDSEVDVVYIASKMNSHFDLCKLYLQAGKHVLCEKSLTCAAWQAKELVALAQAKGVFLMEGIWSRCFPLYAALRKLIDDGELGEIYGVESHLHVATGPWLTEHAELGGAMWDLGVYPLQFVHWVFGGERPIRTNVVGRVHEAGADMTVFGSMQFSKNRYASFSASFADSYNSPSVIYAEKALVTIAGICAPTSMTVSSKGKEARTIKFDPIPTLSYKTNYSSSGGLVYEAEHVHQCITARLVQSPLVPHSLSVWLQETFDDCLRQIGRPNLPSQ